jgi:hypothetical protein
MENNIDRREFIRRSGSFLVLAATGSDLRASPASSELFNLFMNFSRTVIGYEDLEIDVAEKIFNFFLLAYEKEELLEMILSANGSSEFQQDLLATWYSGVLSNNGSENVLIFEEALVWKALRYTKPWSVCGGELGNWGDNPFSGDESGENDI